MRKGWRGLDPGQLIHLYRNLKHHFDNTSHIHNMIHNITHNITHNIIHITIPNILHNVMHYITLYDIVSYDTVLYSKV